MKSSPLLNVVAGLVGFAGLVNGQGFMNAECQHTDSSTVVSVAEWFDTVDVPAFCGLLRKFREERPACAATNTPICEVANGRFEWSFETAGGCTNDDVHEIWTAADGNYLVDYIYC